MTTRFTRAALTMTVLATVAGFTGSAMADTPWQATHPRREEVNNRLGNQHARVAHDRADGTMTKAQARKVHAQDHAIRHEERTMASMDGGHITKSDQRALNQQENAVSREIHRDSGN